MCVCVSKHMLEKLILGTSGNFQLFYHQNSISSRNVKMGPYMGNERMDAMYHTSKL